MKKLLILGGTGRLSKDAVVEALKNDYEVYCLNRGISERSVFLNSNVTNLFADIRKVEEVKSVIDDLVFDVIIDFISFTPDNIKNKLNLFYGKYFQYIFISSATVYEPLLVEHSETDKKIVDIGWDYSIKKMLCEEEIVKYFHNKNDVKYTIIRPYVTYGNTRIPYPIAPRDTLKEWSLVKRIIDEKPIPVLIMENVVTITNSLDFSRALIGLCLNEKAYNNDYHITSQEVVSWEDVIDLCSEYVGKKANKMYIDVNEFEADFPEYIELIKYDKSQIWKFSNQKLLEALPDFKCEIPLKKGLWGMMDYMMKTKEVHNRDSYWEQRINNICR